MKKLLSVCTIILLFLSVIILCSGCKYKNAGLYRNGELIQSWDELLSDCNYKTFKQNGNINANNFASYFKECNGDLVLPEGINTIGKFSFNKCKLLSSIYIPKSVTSIDNTAFLNCKSITVLCKKDSYAEFYAIQNGMRFKTK